MKLLKKCLVFTAVFLAVMFIAYLFGSFCQWSFNPGEWGGYIRAMVGIFGGTFAIIFGVISIIEND
jgi:hypothetical protein